MEISLLMSSNSPIWYQILRFFQFILYSLEYPERILQTGLIPTLLKPLEEHSLLAKRVADVRETDNLLSILSSCSSQFSTVNVLVHEGRLPDAVKACEVLGRMLDASPDPLVNAAVIIDLKVSPSSIIAGVWQ